MSVIEVLLRLGCAMVAWLVIYTHFIWTGTINTVGCGTDGPEIWRLVLGFAPVAIGASFLLPVSRKLREVHKMMRWFGAPLVVLLPLAFIAIWPSIVVSTLGAQGICGEVDIPLWHRWWAPIQLLTILLIVYNVLKARHDINPQ